MTNNELKNKALNLLTDFIKTELPNKRIEDLISYSFWNIKDNDTFNGYSGEYDGDRTNIVYAIDYLLYCDSKIPELTLRGYNAESDTDSNYSGETICSFNTLFAKDSEKRNHIQDLFGPEWAEVENFKLLYQTIGNFMLLPSKTDHRQMSINKYKGSYNKDYIDFFLHNLKFYLDNKSNTKLLGKLIELNRFYFTENKKYDDFIDDFYLSDFKQMKLEGIHYYWWYNNSKIFSDEQVFSKYKLFALDFVRKSTLMINKRSAIIVEHLKEKYKQLNCCSQ
ncbi:MAG: hypothetical protein K6G00_03515 [Treponema sp.]|nr:hypothetical protein [Treponema sp.]